MRAGVKRSECRELGAAEVEPLPRSKVTGSPGCLTRLRQAGGEIAATVRVAEPGYVPSVLRLRSRISPCLFTALIPANSLPELEADPAVVSIQPAERVGPAGR